VILRVRAQSLNNGSSFESVTVLLERGMDDSVASPQIYVLHSHQLRSDLHSQKILDNVCRVILTDGTVNSRFKESFNHAIPF
jgi:hypothetical protein